MQLECQDEEDPAARERLGEAEVPGVEAAGQEPAGPPVPSPEPEAEQVKLRPGYRGRTYHDLPDPDPEAWKKEARHPHPERVYGTIFRWRGYF